MLRGTEHFMRSSEYEQEMILLPGPYRYKWEQREIKDDFEQGGLHWTFLGLRIAVIEDTRLAGESIHLVYFYISASLHG